MSPKQVSFGVPEHARSAWEQMHAQILETGPTPCAEPSVRDTWTGSAAEQETAARLCLDCPVMQACAHYAVTAPEPSGIWGGMTPAERKRWGG